jgi:hypothetical protein
MKTLQKSVLVHTFKSKDWIRHRMRGYRRPSRLATSSFNNCPDFCSIDWISILIRYRNEMSKGVGRLGHIIAIEVEGDVFLKLTLSSTLFCLMAFIHFVE